MDMTVGVTMVTAEVTMLTALVTMIKLKAGVTMTVGV